MPGARVVDSQGRPLYTTKYVTSDGRTFSTRNAAQAHVTDKNSGLDDLWNNFNSSGRVSYQVVKTPINYGASSSTPSQYTSPWTGPPPSTTSLNGVPVSSTPSQYTNPWRPAPIAPSEPVTAPNPRPAPAPVDTRTQAQKDAEFYAAYNAAIDKAIAGDPTDMKNLDKYLTGAERPPIGYTPEYLQLERRAQAAGVSIDQQKANESAMAAGGAPQDPRIAEVNALGIPLDQKVKVIAEIKIGNTDSVSNMVGWLERGNQPQQAAQDYMSTQGGKTDIVNSLNISHDHKVKTIAEIKIGNTDSVSNMVGWLERGNQPQQAAQDFMSTPGGRIDLVNSLNISQDYKNKVIAEIQSGNQDTVSNMVGWLERGNQPSPGALAILNPPAPVPISIPSPSAGTPLVETASETASSVPAPPETEDVLAPSQGNAEEQRRQAEEQAKAVAAQAEADEKKQQALAVATANKNSAKEERIRKINEMRKPWMGGAASASSGSDAMVAPPITPASQVPPPPFQ